jgi:hypothetical protein
MLNRVCRFIAIAIVLTFITGAVDAQVLHHVSRYDASLNPHGAEVLSGTTAQVLGGVVLQGEVIFSDKNGASIPQKNVFIDKYDPADNKLFLSHAKDLFSYLVDKETFDRVFSWVQNNGTGLYTAYPLTVEQRKTGGFSACSASGQTWQTTGFIATEFKTSPKHINLAAVMDFARELSLLRTTERETEIMAKHNIELQPNQFGRDLHWVVSDIDSDFIAKLVNGSVHISGTIYEYSRQASNDPTRVYVSGVKAFSDESSGVELSFARTVALLRTLHRHNSGNWLTFMKRYFVQKKEY